MSRSKEVAADVVVLDECGAFSEETEKSWIVGEELAFE